MLPNVSYGVRILQFQHIGLRTKTMRVGNNSWVWQEEECGTPIEARSLVRTVLKIEQPVTCLATMVYVNVLLFLVLAINSDQFQILHSYTLFL